MSSSSRYCCLAVVLMLPGCGALSALGARGVMTSRDRAVEGGTNMHMHTLVRAQHEFREQDSEGDGKQDYGSLRELGEARLIDERLAQGTVLGYAFDVRPGADGSRWLGIATPQAGVPDSGRGRCQFAANHQGVVYQSWARPFSWNPECEIQDQSLRAYEPPPWTAFDWASLAAFLVSPVLAHAIAKRASRPQGSDREPGRG